MQETRRKILISDKPKWCALMMNGIKTIEVRKNKALAKAIQNLIDEYGYAEIYVYCTKGSKGQLHYSKEYGAFCDIYKGPEHYSENGNLNGKIVFKFRCYKVEEIFMDNYEYQTDSLDEHNLRIKSQLTDNELHKYLVGKNGYAIYISNLEIFDEQKELSEFKHCTEKTCIYGKCHKYMHCLKPLTKAPQNFVYLEVE